MRQRRSADRAIEICDDVRGDFGECPRLDYYDNRRTASAQQHTAYLKH